MGQSYFITGTDTAVGKTLVANALLQLASQQGLSTLGLKPLAAGCEQVDGIWMNEDAQQLMLASTTKPDYATVNPVALREAMAPHIAAARESRTLSCAELRVLSNPSLDNADFTVVEGAGGWLVPLNDDETMADLAMELDLSIILVVGMRLGCINHALLTANAIQDARLGIAGWVANQIDPDMAGLNENIATLEGRLDAPLLGRVPWLPDQDVTTAAKHLDLSLLL
jgi:dethiobiotin synthetase